MVIIKLTCTDQNGHQLAIAEVRGEDRRATESKREEIHRRWNEEHKSHSSALPYIFYETKSV